MHFFLFLITFIVTFHQHLSGVSALKGVRVYSCQDEETNCDLEIPYRYRPIHALISTKSTFEELRLVYMNILYVFVKGVAQMKDELIANEKLMKDEEASDFLFMIATAISNVNGGIQHEAFNVLLDYENYLMWRNGFLINREPPCYTHAWATEMYLRFGSKMKELARPLRYYKEWRQWLRNYFREQTEVMDLILQIFRYKSHSVGNKFLKKILKSEIYDYIIGDGNYEQKFAALSFPACNNNNPHFNVNLYNSTAFMKLLGHNAEEAFHKIEYQSTYIDVWGLAKKLGWEVVGTGEVETETVENLILDQIVKEDFVKNGDDNLVAILLQNFNYFFRGFDPKNKEINSGCGSNIMLAMGTQKARSISSHFKEILAKNDREAGHLAGYFESAKKYLDISVNYLKMILPEPCKMADNYN